MDTTPVNTSTSLLSNGTILNGHYKIDRHYATWRQVNIYIATDTKFREQVYVKELFIEGISVRSDDGQSILVSPEFERLYGEYQSNFNEEAVTLRQLDNPHILHVTDLFQSNNTSYYVMEYVDGELLSDKMLRHNKPLSESSTISHLTQLLDALKSMHTQCFWHLDITPSNILVDNDGICKFIEFGHYKLVDDESTIAINQSHLDPQELEHHDLQNIGPWTDFYSLGSTLYNLLTGKRPPLSTELNEATSDLYSFPTSVSKKMQRLVLWMMTPNIFRRPQDVGEVNEFLYGMNSTNIQDKHFQQTLNSASSISPKSSNRQDDDDEDDDGFGSKTLKGMQIFIFVIALGLLGYLAYTLFTKDKSSSNDENSNTLTLVKEEDESKVNVDTMARESVDVLNIGLEETAKKEEKESDPKSTESKQEESIASSPETKSDNNVNSTPSDSTTKPSVIQESPTPPRHA